jgi:hypothetical protein
MLLRVRLGDPDRSAMAWRRFRAVFEYGDDSRQPGPVVPDTRLDIALPATKFHLRRRTKAEPIPTSPTRLMTGVGFAIRRRSRTRIAFREAGS